MIYWPLFRAGKRAEAIPELADLPAHQRKRIADECACRASISWLALGTWGLYLLFFMVADEVQRIAFPDLPRLARIATTIAALCAAGLKARALLGRAYARRYREEVREYLDKEVPSSP